MRRNALSTPALQQREKQLAISSRGMLYALAVSLSTIREKPALPEFSTPLESTTMPLGALTTAQFLEQYMFLYALMEKASRRRVEDLAYYPTGTIRRTRNAFPVSHFVEIGLMIQPGKGGRALIPYYAIRDNRIIDAPRSKSTDSVPLHEERAHEILVYLQERSKDTYAT